MTMPSAGRTLLCATLLAFLPTTVSSQAQPQGAAPANTGALAFSTTNTAAVTELRAALEDQFNWSFLSARGRLDRALELEPTLGIARSIRALNVGGPTGAADAQRAATEASSASAAEAALALAVREQLAGRAASARRFYQLAADLAPNDRDVAMLRALQLADTARVTALREIAARYPDFAGARNALAFYLLPLGQDSVIAANGPEASRVAFEAVRLAPQSAATHTAVGHVLIAQKNFAEAQKHLFAAAASPSRGMLTYEFLAQTYAVEGKTAELRAALDSASALASNIGTQFFYRRPRALTHLSEGNPQQALAELGQQLKDAEAINARGQIGTIHLWMALVSAGIRDSAGAEQHLAAGRSAEAGAGILADNEVIVYSLIGNPTQARRALGDYIRLGGPQSNLSAQVNAVRTENVHRMTGLVLVAEKKPAEAIAELRQAGVNPYATLGILEALKLQKKNKEADAERAAFFERRNFSFNSSATPIIRYRALKKK
jgi:hypothetical protein